MNRVSRKRAAFYLGGGDAQKEDDAVLSSSKGGVGERKCRGPMLADIFLKGVACALANDSHWGESTLQQQVGTNACRK